MSIAKTARPPLHLAQSSGLLYAYNTRGVCLAESPVLACSMYNLYARRVFWCKASIQSKPLSGVGYQCQTRLGRHSAVHCRYSLLTGIFKAAKWLVPLHALVFTPDSTNEGSSHAYFERNAIFISSELAKKTPLETMCNTHHIPSGVSALPAPFQPGIITITLLPLETAF